MIVASNRCNNDNTSTISALSQSSSLVREAVSLGFVVESVELSPANPPEPAQGVAVRSAIAERPSLVRIIHESGGKVSYNPPDFSEHWRINASKDFHQDFKQRFFVLKAYNGVACGKAKKSKFRWFTLTESNEAISKCISFGIIWHAFVKYIRYYCPDFQYIVVEHRQGDKQRLNRHVLCYGTDKLPWSDMRKYWASHYKSWAMNCQVIDDIDKSIAYLSGYLSKDDKFVRSFCSQGWVYPAWLGIGQTAKREFGRYPTKAETVAIALLSPEARDTVSAVIAYKLNKSMFLRSAKR
jgi:hypothetical protein